VTLPDFDYKAKPEARLEVPIAERIAAIRARKTEDRLRAKANAERRAAHEAAAATRATQPSGGPGRNTRRRRRGPPRP